MNRIIFLRHGQNYFNLEKTHNLDCDITPLGENNAAFASYWLQSFIIGENSVEGFVSPYLYCLQTAKFIYDKFKIKINVEDAISEHPAEYSLHSIENKRESFPEFNWNKVNLTNLNDPTNFMNKLASFMNKVKLSAKDSLIISHLSTIKSMIKWLGVDYHHDIRNGSVLIFAGGKITKLTVGN